MKRVLTISLLIFVLSFTGLFAQSNITLLGGLNFATIKFNDKDVSKYADISAKMRLMIGIESKACPFKFGFTYVQRGSIIKSSMDDNEETFTYDYLAVHSLIPIPLSKQFEIVAGLQAGKCLGGKLEVKNDYGSGSGDIDADQFNVDFGALVGVDIMLGPQFGMRGTYYLGFSDVIKDGPSDSNFKNRGLAINFLVKI